jgi:F420-dependent oxidoreductase-like protein
MKLGFLLGYSGAQVTVPMESILEAENLGFDSAWVAEAYGSDAVSVSSWILSQTKKIKVGTAILQMPARTPTATAMAAMTLDQLSGGRFIVGIGASGPQVAEGWYGEPYGRPITKTKEYIDIMRKVWAREGPLEHEGYHYHIPNKQEGTTGLGKALKSILHGNPDIPVYTANITPAGVRCAAEVADGFFPVWMDPDRYDVFEPYIKEGFEKKGGGTLDTFDIAPFVTCLVNDDIEAARMGVKGMLALYIGGMGARGKNFYNDYATNLGYGDEARKIQDYYLDGKKLEAMAEVPDKLVDEVAIVGPRDRVKGELERWKDAGKNKHVSSMLIGGATKETMQLLAEEML